MFIEFLQVAEPFGTVTAMVIAVYASVKNPQVDMGKEIAVLQERIEKLEKEFSELKENHIKLLYSKIDDLNRNYASLTLEVMKLTTIINERIPASSNRRNND